MWKFKDLYEAVQKKFQSGNLIPKDYKDPEFRLPVHKDPYIWRRYDQVRAWYPGNISMVDKYGDVDIPKNASTHSVQTSASTNILDVMKNVDKIINNQPRYAICKEHGDNYLYYDTNRFKECPKCKEDKEKINIEFLSESDVLL
jgi:hypothetical protein